MNGTIDPTARVAAEVVVGEGTSIGFSSFVGKATVVSRLSTAEPTRRQTTIGDGATIGCLVVICAGVTVGSEVTIGDQAFIREAVIIGDGTSVGRACCLEPGVVLGREVRLQSNVYLAPGARVGDGAFVGPGVLTADDNFMGRGDGRFSAKQAPVIGARSRIGAGAVLLPASVVGDDCYVAAGAVVSGDIPAGSVVMGVPARVTGSVIEFRWNA